MGLFYRRRRAERADHPVAQLVHPFQQAEGSHARDAWTVRGLALGRVVNPTALFGDISAASTPLLIASAPGWRSRSRRMPGEPLDAPDDLQKESRCQVALGQLEPEGPGMPDEASARLEQPLLKTRERPALDGDG